MAISHYVGHNMYIPHKPLCRAILNVYEELTRCALFSLMIQFNYIVFDMFRPTKCCHHQDLYMQFYDILSPIYISSGGTAVAQWLRRCATNRKVASSIPAGVIGIFH